MTSALRAIPAMAYPLTTWQADLQVYTCLGVGVAVSLLPRANPAWRYCPGAVGLGTPGLTGLTSTKAPGRWMLPVVLLERFMALLYLWGMLQFLVLPAPAALLLGVGLASARQFVLLRGKRKRWGAAARFLMIALSGMLSNAALHARFGTTAANIACHDRWMVEDVAGKVMVVHSKANHDQMTQVLSPFAALSYTTGLMSEMKSVLGALRYAHEHGAIGVAVQLENPNYMDAARGDNPWSYFLNPVMPVAASPAQVAALRGRYGEALERAPFVSFDRRFAKHGLFGGFNSLIDGENSRRYPITFGFSREDTAALAHAHLRFKPDVQRAVAAFRKQHHFGDFVAGPGVKAVPFAFDALPGEGTIAKLDGQGTIVLGVHYRGTDTAMHWPYFKVPYAQYSRKVRAARQRFLDAAAVAAGGGPGGLAAAPAGWVAPRVVIFVTTDEANFVARMQEAFRAEAAGDGGRTTVCSYDGSPRMEPSQYDKQSDGLINMKGADTYMKGKSVLVDALLLAGARWLIKGRSNVSEFSLVFNPHQKVLNEFELDGAEQKRKDCHDGYTTDAQREACFKRATAPVAESKEGDAWLKKYGRSDALKVQLG